MERTNKVEEQKPLISYKKLGGGSFRWHGKIIKPGEIFVANPAEIPEAFKNVLLALDKEPEAVKPEPIKGKKTEFEKIQVTRKEIAEAVKTGALSSDFVMETGVKYFNLVNKETKKPINTKPLDETKADELFNDLNK